MSSDTISSIALAKAHAVRGWGADVLSMANVCQYALYLCWVIPELKISFVAQKCRFLGRRPADLIELNVSLPWHAPFLYAVVCDGQGSMYNTDGPINKEQLGKLIKSHGWKAESYPCMPAEETVYETVLVRTNYTIDAMQMQAAFNYYSKEASSGQVA